MWTVHEMRQFMPLVLENSDACLVLRWCREMNYTLGPKEIYTPKTYTDIPTSCNNDVTNEQFESVLSFQNKDLIEMYLSMMTLDQIRPYEVRFHRLGLELNSPYIFYAARSKLDFGTAKLAIEQGRTFIVSYMNQFNETEKEKLWCHHLEHNVGLNFFEYCVFNVVDDALLENNVTALNSLFPRRPSHQGCVTALKAGSFDALLFIVHMYPDNILSIDDVVTHSPSLEAAFSMFPSRSVDIIKCVLKKDKAMLIRLMLEVPELIGLLVEQVSTFPKECKNLATNENYRNIIVHYARAGKLKTLVQMNEKLGLDITPDILHAAVECGQWDVPIYFVTRGVELPFKSLNHVIERHEQVAFPDDVYEKLVGKYYEDKYVVVSNPCVKDHHIVIDDRHSADAAAAEGDLDGLKALYQQGYPVTDEGIKAATLAGHTHILVWLCGTRQ